jgi:hypothetical protein
MPQGILVVNTNDKSMPKQYKEFISLLKQKGLKGKIRDNKGHLEFFSPQASLDTDFWEGYQIFIIDEAETKK